MSKTVIKVENLHKTFLLPHEKRNSVKSLLIDAFKKKTFETQKVLNGISFEVKEGEFFGIVGRNGSGKSTLLKILAGIYSPNRGGVKIDGRLTPFIELGVGFSPELTGRENVYLNGALLGFTRKEMDAMYDEIVEFAELKKFMDQKLKNYSSGMQVRLAFSIAIRASSDILVLDEVLAVGDEAFQRKCLDIFENYKAQKKTVILVTHDMNTVKRFCSRALLINRGKIIEIGDPGKVSKHYTSLNDDSHERYLENDNQQQTQLKYRVNLSNEQGKKCSKLHFNERASVSLSWHGLETDVSGVGVAILKQSGEYVFGTNTFIDKLDISDLDKLDYQFEVSLGEGTYVIKTALFGKDETDIVAHDGRGIRFVVANKDSIEWGGVAYLKHEWKK